MDEANLTRIKAASEAIQQEFPETGVVVLVVGAKGNFSYASNMGTGHLIGVLEHVVRHLKGECKC